MEKVTMERTTPGNTDSVRGKEKKHFDAKGKELLCRMSSLLIKINIYGKLKPQSLLLEKQQKRQTRQQTREQSGKNWRSKEKRKRVRT